jgi:hypothetical protein
MSVQVRLRQTHTIHLTLTPNWAQVSADCIVPNGTTHWTQPELLANLNIFSSGTLNTGTTETNAFAGPDTISKFPGSGWSTVLMSGTHSGMEHAFLSNDHPILQLLSDESN